MTMGWWNWFPCLSFDFAINQHHEQWACRFSGLLKVSVLMAHNTLLVGNEPTSFQLPALSLKHHTTNSCIVASYALHWNLSCYSRPGCTSLNNKWKYGEYCTLVNTVVNNTTIGVNWAIYQALPSSLKVWY